jgi:tRNA(Ile)-lysidine synthase
LVEPFLSQKRRPAFVRLPVATQRQCLRLQLAKLNVASDFDLIEQLREEPNQLVNVSPTLAVARDSAGLVRVRTQSSVAFNPGEIEIALNGEEGEKVFDGVRCRWKVELVAGSKLSERAAGRELFDADKVGSRIVLRHWRAGDRFQPIGMAAPVKLQDWFTNQKVPRARRHKLLVAEAACGGIFWIEGQRISDEFKLTPGTRRRLIWRWQRG